MPRESAIRDSSEKLQIAVLTLGMTGGGFAVLTLILAFYMNPAAAERAELLKGKSEKLMNLLQTTEVRQLRAKAKLNEGQEDNRGIREIVFEATRSRGLERGTVPGAKITDLKDFQKVEQTVNLKPGKLLQILQFIGDLKDAKKTIQIESVTMTRDRRARAAGDDDSWTCVVRVVDYVRKST